MARKRKIQVSPEANPASGEGVGEPEVDGDRAWVARVRERLVAWYEREHRDLPWRGTRDPYRILVSEMMLVQTTVAAVVPYFDAVPGPVPDVRALAEADEAGGPEAWEGLGYYRRARQLHAAARAIVADHGGDLPRRPRRHPGLAGGGPLHRRGHPLVRLRPPRADRRGQHPARPGALAGLARGPQADIRRRQRLWQAAGRLVPPTGAGTFNQAFMELGALVCIPRAPLCLVCPVAAECRARALGVQEQVPVAAPKPPPLGVAEACALVTRRGRVLIVQRGPGGLWEQFWEFPTIHLAGADPAGRSVRRAGRPGRGGPPPDRRSARIGPLVADRPLQRNQAPGRARRLSRPSASSEPLIPGPGLVRAAWESPEALVNYPFGSAHRRLIAWVAKHGADGRIPTRRRTDADGVTATGCAEAPAGPAEFPPADLLGPRSYSRMSQLADGEGVSDLPADGGAWTGGDSGPRPDRRRRLPIGTSPFPSFLKRDGLAFPLSSALNAGRRARADCPPAPRRSGHCQRTL